MNENIKSIETTDSTIVGVSKDGKNITRGDVVAGNSFNYANFSVGADLSGVDLSGKSFTGANFVGVNHGKLSLEAVNPASDIETASTKKKDLCEIMNPEQKGTLGNLLDAVLRREDKNTLLTRYAIQGKLLQLPENFDENALQTIQKIDKIFELIQTARESKMIKENAARFEGDVKTLTKNLTEIKSEMVTKMEAESKARESKVVGKTAEGKDITLRELERGQNFIGADFSGADLSGIDLKGKMFNGACFIGAKYDRESIKVEDLAPKVPETAETPSYKQELYNAINPNAPMNRVMGVFSKEDVNTLLTRYAIQGKVLSLPSKPEQNPDETIKRVNEINTLIERASQEKMYTPKVTTLGGLQANTRIGNDIQALQAKLNKLQEGLQAKYAGVPGRTSPGGGK